ncbi:MAG TPA: DUF427 domain-containing protein, partial [Candidatus Nanopelagicales bacterium]|nr:DUF427 domain-containing protein [Candidatus Nanopelagicales bacterium]
EDIRMDLLTPTGRRTFCEFKGNCVYWSLAVGDRRVEEAAWSYPDPMPGSESIASRLGFYAGRVDECLLDEERATPQDGGFYGGWVTKDIVGPFKGGPGTWGW